MMNTILAKIKSIADKCLFPYIVIFFVFVCLNKTTPIILLLSDNVRAVIYSVLAICGVLFLLVDFFSDRFLFKSRYNGWLALFLITVFAEQLHWLPTSGLDRGAASLVLPSLALAAANVGMTSRLVRGNVIAQLGEQYILVANAKGLPQRVVVLGHALRNSLVPIITMIGNYFGGILGGSTIIETIFAIPGMGSYVLSAIQNRDYPVIQGYVLITGATFVLSNLAIDLLYIAADPKIRVGGGAQ